MGFPSLFERTSLIQVLPLRQGLHFCFNEAEEMRAQLAEFKIEFEDGSSAIFYLADPGSSIAMRDKNNSVEYLG